MFDIEQQSRIQQRANTAYFGCVLPWAQTNWPSRTASLSLNENESGIFAILFFFSREQGCHGE